MTIITVLLLLYVLSISAELTAYLYYTQADVWIGLSDIGQSGKFHWVDSSTLDYTNWLPGQPDGQILQPDGVSLTLYCSPYFQFFMQILKLILCNFSNCSGCYVYLIFE